MHRKSKVKFFDAPNNYPDLDYQAKEEPPRRIPRRPRFFLWLGFGDRGVDAIKDKIVEVSGEVNP